MSKADGADWNTCSIGQLGRLSTSSVDKKSSPDERQVRLLNYMDIYRNNFIGKNIPFSRVTASQREIESFRVIKGDVFFTPSSETPDDIGHSGVIVDDLIDVLQSYHLMRLRFSGEKTVDLRFKGYVFRSEDVYRQFRVRATGSTRFTLTIGDIAEVVVRLPPLAEQKKIAEILSAVDEVIENTESEINKLEDLKKATLNELLTKGIGHTEFKDSAIGLIPKSWKVVPLGDIVKFGGGSAFSESLQGEKQGDFPFIKVSDMNHIENTVWIVHSENWITKSVKEENKIKLFPVNAVVFAKVGAALMLNRRRILSRPTAIDNNMMAAIPHGCDSKFLYWLMCRMDFRRLVQDGAVPSVNQSQLDEIIVALPNASEQRDIAVRLDCLASVIEERNTGRDAMVSVRAGLMQDLLTGKVRVKVN